MESTKSCQVSEASALSAQAGGQEANSHRKEEEVSTLPPKEVSRQKLGDKTPSVETLPCHACQFQTFYKQSLRKHIIRFHGDEEIS